MNHYYFESIFFMVSVPLGKTIHMLSMSEAALELDDDESEDVDIMDEPELLLAL